jgi:hypothetical protein
MSDIIPTPTIPTYTVAAAPNKRLYVFTYEESIEYQIGMLVPDQGSVTAASTRNTYESTGDFTAAALLAGASNDEINAVIERYNNE